MSATEATVRLLREGEARLARARRELAAFNAEWNAAAEERMSLTPPRERGVYFVEAIGTGLVKIGWAKIIAKRFAALQRMNGAQLRLLRWEPGWRSDERTMHERWAYLRTHGEWFTVSEALAFYMGHTPGASIARYLEGGGYWWETAA
jgi:hypothetical protein